MILAALTARAPTLAYASAVGLAAVAFFSWLMPGWLPSSGLIVVAQPTLASLVEHLASHRELLALFAAAGVVVLLVDIWALPHPLVGALVLLCVTAEIAALAATAPLVVLAAALLAVNAAVWLGVLWIIFVVVWALRPRWG